MSEPEQAEQAEPPATTDGGAPPALWVSSTYFAEGFPYAVVNSVADILWKDLGASYGAVGLTSLFHLPWNLKLLWGPWVDRYETKRWWLVLTEIVLTALLVGIVAVTALGGTPWLALSLLFVAMAFLAATHDVAIDGFYLEALDTRQQSTYVGVRAPAYRIATLVFGPLLVLKDFTSWFWAFVVVLGVMALLTAGHLALLPRPERRRRPIGELLRATIGGRAPWIMAAVAVVVAVAAWWSDLGAVEAERLAAWGKALGAWFAVGMVAVLFGLIAALPLLRGRLEAHERRDASSDDGYARAFLEFVAQPRVALILLFVVFFRTGESFLLKMKYPFMSDAMHMTSAEYGYANLLFGVLASFLGTAVGGWLISRHGLRRWTWPFVAAQNLPNLIFMLLALLATAPGIAVLTGAICIEQFGAGLGTAVFMVYLMRCCHPAHRAAHMAILTALMSVSFTIAGTVSGFLVERMGFGWFFGLTFLATFPAMLLIPFLPHLDPPSDPDPEPTGDATP